MLIQDDWTYQPGPLSPKVLLNFWYVTPVERMEGSCQEVVKEAMRCITENFNSLQDWCTGIERMRRTGFSDEEMTKALTDEIARIIARPVSEMPDYLRISIKISVLGFLRYLNR